MKRLAALFLLTLVACSGPPPAPPPKKEAVASWADVFDGTPDFFAVIRPKALKRDPLYGSFWTSLVRVAQSRGIARGGSMLEAVEGADEIVVGLNRGLDAALVLRGVPASLDPQTITDAEGRTLFRPMNDRSRIVEYELTDRRDVSGGLFVLPDRTWVGTLGDARVRARQAFATPLNRPTPRVDADALVAVRIAGPLTQALANHPVFGSLTKKLASATFSLKPWKDGFVIALLYEDADAVAWGESQLKKVAADLAKDEKRFGWLKTAKVAYEGNTVVAHVAVPPRLLEELPSASGASLGL